MRKSVLSVLAVAAFAASAFTLDTAAARGHGGGGGGGSFHGPSGGASFSHGGRRFSGGSVQSFGRVSGPNVAARSFSNNQNVRSFNGRQFSHRDFDHGFRHHHHGRNFAFAAFPFGFYDGFYNDYAYDYDYDCYRLRRVHTPWGWRLRRVYVCDYPY
jgi:hypothetical protein